jgi:hypothetical protein
MRCPAKYLERAPSPGASGVAPAQRDAQMAAATSTLIGETEGRLSKRSYTALPSLDPAAFTTKSLLTFASKVEQVGSEYTYTYTVTNESDSALKFDWLAAGLSGELDAATSTSRSFVSGLAPTSVPSIASALLGHFQAGGGLELLTPVPEPSQLLLALAGLVLLAIRLGRRAY